MLLFRSLAAIVGCAFLGSSVACARSEHRALGGFETADEGGAGIVDDGGSGMTSASGSTTSAAGTAPSSLGVALFSASCAQGGPKVDWSPIRRISRVEYDNMVRDLLGDATQPAAAFVPESEMTNGVNFQNNTYSGVSELIAQQYIQAAETLAATAVSSASGLTTLLGCSTQDDACATQFIGTFTNLAFRGQLDAVESAGLAQLYSTVKAQFDFTTGIQAVITAVLESPRFLYVTELGAGAPSGNVITLSQNELAGRLALFLWRSVPDAALLQAASAGQLTTSVQIQAQATRMLADRKAKDALDDFTTQWLQLQATPTLGKDTQFAAWNGNPKLGEEMADETRLNLSTLVLTSNDTLTALLTSPSSYINQDLATFYGVSLAQGTTLAVPDSALSGGQGTFAQTVLPNRAGVLTNGSVLATQAHTTLPSSVLRGKLVRENVLCDPLPPPPPNVPPAPTSVPEGGTTREAFAAHEVIPGCVTCHTYMDPIGFGFGNFDATGAYQATDANGLSGTFPPIDSSGQVNPMHTGELSATFTDAVDLATQLSTATQTRECFALQEFRYALSRMETPNDACSAQQIYASFSASRFNIQALLLAVVGADAFRYRSIEAAGSACQ
jgi:Protein of unknown function (DUF1592)/Protein of unknown function (DUF1588)/Protein of unknown function (DUF1595)/Protein of unknown function (DUF1587)/Protein of unknown function (DUF1585)